MFNFQINQNTKILGWPKSSYGFSYKLLQKNLNNLFSQLNVNLYYSKLMEFQGCFYFLIIFNILNYINIFQCFFILLFSSLSFNTPPCLMNQVQTAKHGFKAPIFGLYLIFAKKNNSNNDQLTISISITTGSSYFPKIAVFSTDLSVLAQYFTNALFPFFFFFFVEWK